MSLGRFVSIVQKKYHIFHALRWISTISSAEAASKSDVHSQPHLNVLERPEEPGAEDCCGNGCMNCVWTQYYERLRAYEEATSPKVVVAYGGHTCHLMGNSTSSEDHIANPKQ
mmetsp:Transcript_9501/g.16241  ORF Transcript_9501/g.16241 Transcript_9501/m.16241 type:complete len:113 (+) Transcript_9501:182-520(+)|eukprot:CAMPEP_0184331912 /NCGR_PEP_ID=MMETSP1089-20130417/1212_1 /TAXON_ID=38269 ORGANISM="Gloeochaete wittrockiana, Strain SAG46.84" /NCGR_SAMPLE_ID=MMETSP1089 /ASSEMBLY_ACC=CAM_ASM_000445 /LENGTH=112 /DNA_ID=CAMNT_0026655085 /DNA_START=142 /DNA_END=480 /DNA_ORIENTATION=+